MVPGGAAPPGTILFCGFLRPGAVTRRAKAPRPRPTSSTIRFRSGLLTHGEQPGKIVSFVGLSFTFGPASGNFRQ
jgi:hypothetical protein